jgi:hypothetical protein
MDLSHLLLGIANRMLWVYAECNYGYMRIYANAMSICYKYKRIYANVSEYMRIYIQYYITRTLGVGGSLIYKYTI